MIFGRSHELFALNNAYAQMLAGHGSVLFLTGEAGLGKTTLVHTWAEGRDTRETASDEQPSSRDTLPVTLFLESACSIPIGNVDVGRLEALQPWVDVVAQLHEKLSTQSTAKGKSQHKLNLSKLMRDSAPAWLWALPFVGEVAHAALVTARLAKDQRSGKESQIHSPTGPDPSLDERQFAAANQEQVFQQYVNLLTKISESTPLIIFLDDLHWADTSSCNLLFYLARHIARKQILVIATYRQDDAMRAEDGKGHPIITVKNEILRYSTGKELALSYLNRDAIRAFQESTFAGYTVDEKFEHWLHNISDGNSLFMTQFVRTLREDGHLNDHGKFVGDYATIVIPSSALAVVEERSRRLDGDTRKLLMYATAEGEEFTTYVLEHLTKKDPMALLDELHAATTMGLITQRGTGRLYANTTTGIFGFSHALFHKALYDGLLDMQKQHLHQQCFYLLKTEWDRLSDTKDRTTTIATKLLAHAEKCEEWKTVAEVALAVAKEFWRSFNEDETLAMIRRVLDACAFAQSMTDAEEAKEGLRSQGEVWIHAQRGEALILRGDVGQLRGRHEESIDDYRAAEVEFTRANIAKRAVDAVNGLSRTLLRTSSYDEALTEASRAIDQARTIGHRHGEAYALNICGIVHADRGANDEALMQYERSRGICAEIDYRLGEANALINIGNIYLKRTEIDQALNYYKQSFAIFSALGNRLGEANTLHNIGVVYAESGANDEALLHFEQSLSISTAIGDRLYEANSLNSIGNLHKDYGAYDKALSYFNRSLEICADAGDRSGESYALGNIGAVHAGLQAYDEALSNFNRSLEIQAAIGNREGEAISLHSIGWTLRMSGKISEARDYIERSLAMATAISSNTIAAHNTAELGLVTEAESQTLFGVERDVKRSESWRLITEALVVFRELKLNKEIDEWEKELERIRAAS